MNGPSHDNQPAAGTVPVDQRLPQSPRPASNAAANSTMASSTMPTTSNTTATLLSLVVMTVVDAMIRRCLDGQDREGL